MTSGERRRLDFAIWGIIIGVTGMIVLASATGSLLVAWSSFLKPGLVSALLIAGSVYYRYFRRELPLAEALAGASQIIAFASVAAPFSYVAATAALPLWDAEFATWDRRLGFDWMAWLAVMNARPLLHGVAAAAYGSFAVQTTVVVMALSYARQARQRRIFQFALMATTLVTIAISALMPAQGVWGHWHLTLHDTPNIVPVTRDLPLSVFFGLRDGTYRLLVADHAQGIISFPSLHAALGLLFILGCWPVKFLRWIGLAVNTVMIAATPIDGSHYFIDVIAGLAVAGSAWFATSRLLSPRKTTPTGPVRAGMIAAPNPALTLGDPHS